MVITVQRVRELMEVWQSNPKAFMEQCIDENVKWTNVNPDPKHKSCAASGVFTSRKEFIQENRLKTEAALTTPIHLELAEEPLVTGDWAVVEVKVRALDGSIPKGKNGTSYDQRRALIMHIAPETERIVEVRAYFDSAMTRDLLA